MRTPEHRNTVSGVAVLRCVGEGLGGSTWHPEPVPRVFSARDRRSLSAVLAAGLRHAQLDQLVAVYPVPGDPGHDAGKAGRVGLFTATLLAGTDHRGLVDALELVESEKIPAERRGSLERLRSRAGLGKVSASPEAAGQDGPASEPPLAAVVGEDVPPPAEVSPAGPVVILEQLEEGHPVVQVLREAGVQVVPGGRARVPAGALVLRPAGAG